MLLREAGNFSKHRWLIASLIVLGIAIAYWPIYSAGYIWDDDLWILSNPTLRTFKGFLRIWYDLDVVPEFYPLTLSTFWAEFQLWGLYPLGYHIDNLILHATNAILVGLLLYRLRVPGAGLIALLFAVHPVQVESVAWITERKNTLSGLFALLSLLMYRRFDPLDGTATSKRKFYFASLFCFLLAVLAKTVVVTLPGVLVVIIWWKKGRLQKADWARCSAFFAISLAAGAFATWMQHHHTGASGRGFDFSPMERFLIAGHALGFYLCKIIWPANLIFIYPRWNVHDHAAWQFVLLGGWIALLITLWFLRTRIGRGSLAAPLIFAGVLFPALGFFNVYWQLYSFVADHMLYLAVVPILAIVVNAINRLRAPAVVWGLVVVLTIALGIRTSLQVEQYHDALTLWQATALKNSGSWMVRTNLGHALVAAGRQAEADQLYEAAWQLTPDIPDTARNRGVMLARRGDMSAAIDMFRQSIAIDPTFAIGYESLSRALLSIGKVDEADQLTQQAIAHCPRSEIAWSTRAEFLVSQNRSAEAIAAYKQAIQFRPSNGMIHFALGNLLLTKRDLDNAAAEFSAAIDNLPEMPQAYTNLGAVELMRGNPQHAADLFQRALQFDPNQPQAKAGLRQANSLLRNG